MVRWEKKTTAVPLQTAVGKEKLLETLPATIVAQVNALGHALNAVASQHREGDLATLEAATLDVIREAMPHLLEAVLTESTESLRTPGARQRACPGCGKRVGVQNWRARTLTTVCGPITRERPWYRCQTCRHGWSPTDQTWKLEPRQRLSGGISAWLVELGGRTSFGEAQTLLATLTGLHASPETVRQRTEKRGKELEETATQVRGQVMRTREAAEEVDPAPGLLVVETDGVQARYRSGWHEVKLGVVGGQVNGELQAQSYVAARETAEVFGSRLLSEAARRGALEIVGWEGKLTGKGLARLRKVVVLGDGAHWIWNLAAEHFGERIEIIDFYHASEHVWNLAHALFGEGTPLAERWADFALAALYHQGATALLSLLDQTTPPKATAKVFRTERQYFRTNQTRMDYPAFRQDGLPIGSGAVESAAKHLVQQRMKRPGARWSDEGGQAVLNVRCHLLSNRPLAA